MQDSWRNLDLARFEQMRQRRLTCDHMSTSPVQHAGRLKSTDHRTSGINGIERFNLRPQLEAVKAKSNLTPNSASNDSAHILENLTA